jgi:uncharacterized membrane protein
MSYAPVLRTTIWVVLTATIVITHAIPAKAQENVQGNESGHRAPQETQFFRAKVFKIDEEGEKNVFGRDARFQKVLLQITSGEEKGEEIEIEHGLLITLTEANRVKEGETVIVAKVETPNGIEYYITEKYRLPAIITIFAIFILLVLLLGKWRGLTSLIGLGFTLLVLVYFIVPRISSGENPLLVSVGGSVIIACVSLYLAHGFSKRTSIALTSTLITIGIATGLAVAFVAFGKLFGIGTEEAIDLQFDASGMLNLQGLLLGGIIIGTLGVLDDITTAQTAAIDEIKKANPALTFRELYTRGLSVGKEHIASLVNTLVLVYVGASLPLLLIFTAEGEDNTLWLSLNSPVVAEEVIRTLVGSTTLLFAVPIATFLAAYFLRRNSNSQKSKM